MLSEHRDMAAAQAFFRSARAVTGVTPDQVAAVWPDAQEFGYRDEAEAFLLQYGHGVGLSLWERPIISKRYTGQNTPLKEGMVFALETW